MEVKVTPEQMDTIDRYCVGMYGEKYEDLDPFARQYVAEMVHYMLGNKGEMPTGAQVLNNMFNNWYNIEED